MTSLASSQAEQLALQLRAQRDALVARLRERLHGGDDAVNLSLVNHFDLVGDRVEANVFSGNDMAMINHELTELKDVETALKRIEDNTYGICMRCGEDIDPRRLNAQPTALCCVPCLEAFEKRSGSVWPAEQ